MGRDANGNYTGPDITRRPRSERGAYTGPNTGNSGGTFGGGGGYTGPQIDSTPTFRGGDYSGPNGGGGNSNTRGARGLWGVFDFVQDFNGNYARTINSQATVVRAERRLGRENEYLFRDQSGLNARDVNSIQRARFLEQHPEYAQYLYGGGGSLPQRYGQPGYGAPQGGVPYAASPYGMYNGGAYALPPTTPQATAPQVTAPAPQVTPPAAALTPQANGQPLAAAAGQPNGGAAPNAAAPGANGDAAAAAANGNGAPPAGAETAPAAAAPSLAAASGNAAGRFGVRRQPAPRANEIPKIAQNQVEALQDLLIAAGHSVGTMGSDGKYGPNTQAAVVAYARTLGITDVHSLDFTVSPPTGDTKRFLDGLTPNRTPAVAPAAAPAATPDPAIAAEAQRRAAEAQRQAAINASIPESVRGTPYDPRSIEGMNEGDRYRLAVRGLHGIDELANERNNVSMGTLRGKMNETIRRVNDTFNLQIPELNSAESPLSDRAMVALGMRAAYEGRLTNNRNQLVDLPEGMTQAQMNAAAVQYIRALDRGVDREDPSRAIRRFEERDMGRSGIEVDGLADPQMLAALRQAVAVRNGLATVSGPQAPAPQVPAPEAAVTLPGVTGGANVSAAPTASTVANGQPPAPAAGRSNP